MNLSGVQSRDVPAIWPFVEEMFVEAMKARGSDWTSKDIERSLEAGAMQLWLATSQGRGIEAALITEIKEYREEPACSIFAVVGEDHQRWVAMLAEVERWAASLGCRRVVFWGRPGWQRVLKDYRTARVFMERELDG